MQYNKTKNFIAVIFPLLFLFTGRVEGQTEEDILVFQKRLEDRFSEEHRNDSWAESIESILETSFLNNQSTGLIVSQVVRCKTTMCRIEVEGLSEPQIKQIMKMAMALDGSKATLYSFELDREQEQVRILIFYKKEEQQ